MFNFFSKKDPQSVVKTNTSGKPTAEQILRETLSEVNEFKRLSEKYGTIVETPYGTQIRTSVKSFGKNPKKGRNII